MTAIEELQQWLTVFADYVRHQDFQSARAMFFDDALGFGSQADMMMGIDDLMERQWKTVWPNITDFSFSLEHTHYEFSKEFHSACVIAPWASTGYHHDGRTFLRPGRSTIFLLRHAETHVWLAKHTHFSLNPGTPYQTFGHSSS